MSAHVLQEQESRSGLLWMANDAPHALFEDTGPSLGLVLVQLVIRQRLQGKARRKHAHGSHLHPRMVPGQHGAFVSEWRSEGQANQHLEEGLGDECREQRLVPKILIFLDIFVTRVIFTTLDRASRNAGEETSTPERHAG
jgi:hypothetical protein